MSRIKRMKSNCFITGDPDLITGPRDVVLSRQHDRYRKQHTHQHVCWLISSRPAACDERLGLVLTRQHGKFGLQPTTSRSPLSHQFHGRKQMAVSLSCSLRRDTASLSTAGRRRHERRKEVRGRGPDVLRVGPVWSGRSSSH